MSLRKFPRKSARFARTSEKFRFASSRSNFEQFYWKNQTWRKEKLKTQAFAKEMFLFCFLLLFFCNRNYFHRKATSLQILCENVLICSFARPIWTVLKGKIWVLCLNVKETQQAVKKTLHTSFRKNKKRHNFPFPLFPYSFFLLASNNFKIKLLLFSINLWWFFRSAIITKRLFLRFFVVNTISGIML